MDIYGAHRGEKVVTYDRQNNNIIKDNIITQLIPSKISECALYLGNTDGVCITDETTTKIKNLLGIISIKPYDIIEDAKSKLNCENQHCVLSKTSHQIGNNIAQNEIKTRLKIKGPTNTQLLSNVNIDAVLAQLQHKYKDFYPYNFNMLNYASYSYKNGYILNQPDTLSTILFNDLYNSKENFKCAGCVINTDTYQGAGKHWMALFADARADNEWSVEFFNSSGNAPAPEWVSWMVKTKTCMESLQEEHKLQIPINIVKVSNIRHQQSRSECGPYSLFYIWARLNGIPYKYFSNNPIPDRLMFEFRAHVFNDGKHANGTTFDWDKYRNEVNIQWE